MGTDRDVIITVNVGSSSLKLNIYNAKLEPFVNATASNINQNNAAISIEDSSIIKTNQVELSSHVDAANYILDNVKDTLSLLNIVAIGHRIVHGGDIQSDIEKIDQSLLNKLKEFSLLDPEHFKASSSLINNFEYRYPKAIQIACYDSAFYKNMPKLAKLLPLPRKYEKLGVKRYGFHGLSYEFIKKYFQTKAGDKAVRGRVIMAHLGGGASLTALNNSEVVDTTMSLSPASGIPMSTRSGDLDPGIIHYLHLKTGMSIDDFNQMVHFESGLFGISEYSPDMELLIKESAQNDKAKDAVNYFCTSVKKTIGSLSAAIGGLDSLIFSGGIGENSTVIRSNICSGLEYLGINLDNSANAENSFLISSKESRVGVHVIKTDEAKIIAYKVQQYVNINLNDIYE